MGRPALGKAAKSVLVTVRLTPREDAVLTRRYGDTRKALRALVAAETGKERNSDDTQDFRAGR
jgi:hypothetical protein